MIRKNSDGVCHFTNKTAAPAFLVVKNPDEPFWSVLEIPAGGDVHETITSICGKQWFADYVVAANYAIGRNLADYFIQEMEYAD